MRRAYHTYDRWLRSNPLRVKMITSGVVVCASDASIQLLKSSRTEEGIPYSPWRTFVVGVGYGAFWFAPVLHGITNMWARVLPSASFPSLVTKLVVDMTTSFPVNVSVMLAAQAVARQEKDIRGAIEANIVASVTDGWKFWTPATLVMYSVVPLRYRVAFLNVGSFFWNGWLNLRFQAAPASSLNAK